ncbi:MAG: 2-succinylbenzoate--CoA ligase [Acidobacteria bacterium]|nr:MAG: 2-succinylbenzoate--CoA ligase [Acidobacteriota bacterium]
MRARPGGARRAVRPAPDPRPPRRPSRSPRPRARGGDPVPDGLSVRAAAREAGARLALIAPGLRATWRELAERAAEEAAALRRRGADPELPFPVTVRADAESVVLLLALIEEGITAVPLDARWTESERSAALARLAPPPPLEGDPHDPERPLAIVFTSGTSARPKAVVLSRRAFAAAAAASASVLGWREDDRWLLCLSPARIGGLAVLTRCLAARRPVVVSPRFEPEGFARIVSEERITLVSLVPAMLAELLRRLPAWRPPRHLRAVLLGGASAGEDLLDEARRRGVPVAPCYGASETCAHVTLALPGAAAGCGPPLPGVEVAVRDGRLCVRGPVLFSGYADAGRIAGGPDAAGWWETGDVGRIDSAGCVHVTGRADETIVSGGENVSPAAVERVLRGHPAIRDALVAGVPDERWGQVVGALIVTEGPPPARPALDAWLRARLSGAARPRRWRVVDALPLTREGKPDRRQAARLLADPAPPESGQ